MSLKYNVSFRAGTEIETGYCTIEVALERQAGGQHTRVRLFLEAYIELIVAHWNHGKRQALLDADDQAIIDNSEAIDGI